jgi:hypothetical protein
MVGLIRSVGAGLWLVVCVAGAMVDCAWAQEDRILPLDGGWASGRIERMDATKAYLSGSARSFDLQELQRIERPAATQPVRPAILVHLIDGSVLRAADVSVASEKCTVRWAAAQPTTLGLSAIRGIRLAQGEGTKPDAAPLPAFEEALRQGKSKQDALYVIADGQAQVVEGALQEMDARDVTFVWGGSARKIARSKPYGLTLATLASPPDLSGMCLVRLVDGSTLWGRVKELAGGKLTLTAHSLDIALPWDRVAQIIIRSDRVTYLSDLEPVEVVEEALVTFAGPWRRDQNVLGGKLMLGSTVYERGLGTHSRSFLTFAPEGNYSFFWAVIGIDAQTRGKGDCIFKVIGDEKELFSQRVKGTDKPTPVRLKIDGVKRLVLAVEEGEELDLSDHANWCDARFEKAKAAKE